MSGWLNIPITFCTRTMEEKMKNKMTGTVAFIGLAFLLGTAVIGCQRGDDGAPGAPGAQGASAPAPAPAAPQVAEKTSQSSTTTDSNPGGSTTTTDKSSTKTTN